MCRSSSQLPRPPLSWAFRGGDPQTPQSSPRPGGPLEAVYFSGSRNLTPQLLPRVGRLCTSYARPVRDRPRSFIVYLIAFASAQPVSSNTACSGANPLREIGHEKLTSERKFGAVIGFGNGT